jgi:lipopolysaccharide transport system ATP-binding protein
MAGTPFNTIPENGEAVCRIPRCPFSPGSYSLNIYCEVNGILADWVQEAKQVTVVEGDFYGTGKLPSVAHGGFLVDQHWDIY